MPRRTIKGSGKKQPLNMRTTAELRRRIEKAAGKSGRSMVQEVEYRLELSFQQDRMVHIVTNIDHSCWQIAARVSDLHALACEHAARLDKMERMWADVVERQTEMRARHAA